MSLMELFSGNPGNPEKKTGVTATGHATQGGNPGNPEKTITEKQNDILKVFCYSPSGLCYEVEARDEERAAWLLKMNPKPTIEQTR